MSKGLGGNFNGNASDDFPLNTRVGGVNTLNEIYAKEFQTDTVQ